MLAEAVGMVVGCFLDSCIDFVICIKIQMKQRSITSVIKEVEQTRSCMLKDSMVCVVEAVRSTDQKQERPMSYTTSIT